MSNVFVFLAVFFGLVGAAAALYLACDKWKWW